MTDTLSAKKKETPEHRNDLDEREPRWFAVYTRFKREKMVQKRLRNRGIEIYLPLQPVTRRYVRKVKHLELPLISCYVFTRITKREYVSVLEDPDVLRFIRIAKDLIAIPEREMDILRRIVGENIEAVAEPTGYQVGDAVEIVAGQLTGLQGTLVDKDGQKHFLVELSSIGQTLRMQIDPKYLRVTQRNAARDDKANRNGGADDALFQRYR